MMPKDHSMWGPSDRAHNRPRTIFLRELAGHAPEVLQHLHDQVLPEYVRLYPELSKETSNGPRTQRVRNWVGWLFKDEPPTLVLQALPDILCWKNIDRLQQQYSSVSVVKEELIRWSQEFRLTDEWLLDTALQTVYRMRTVRMSPLRFWRVPVFSEPPLNLDGVLQFMDTGWSPHLETWKEFHDRIVSAFDEHLKQYRTKIKTFLAESGWTQRPEIRQKKHYTWLVLYQVKLWSPGRILDDFPPDERRNTEESTVTKGVENTARMARVTLRPSRRGTAPRPRRVKT